MSNADLGPAVKRLQDCWECLSSEQASLRRANALLEQRVRDLELHLAEQFMEEAQPDVDVPFPVQVCNVFRQAGAVSPGGALDSGGDAAGETAACKSEERDGAAEEGEGEGALLVKHSLGETIWDGAVFAGLPQLTRGGSAILLFSMLLNAFVQTYICAVLLSSQEFMQQRRYRDLEAPMREFRLAYAHDLSQVDAKGQSLASRVCEEDQSLYLAVTQTNILGEINAYLALGSRDLHRERLGTGPLLCGVCVFLFATAVLRELRKVASSTWAVCALPREGRTRLEGGRFSALSTGRLACILANNALRTGIAIMLLCTGIIWLSSTSSITDLILNAAALCFVMDVDECLFQTTVPASVHTFVQGLRPLTYKRSRWNSEALLPLLAIVAIVVLSFPLLIQPNMEDMLAVKRALCDGNLDFMTTMTQAGLVVTNRTTPFHARHAPSILESAALELLASAEPDKQTMQFSYFSKTPASFLEVRAWSYPSFAEQWTCVNLDTRFGGQFKALYPFMFTAVRHATGLHAGISLLERTFNCTEYAAFCQSVRLVRTMCPITCGCDDPTSGLLHKQPKQGCPSVCREARQRHLESRACVDMNVTAQWRSYWAALGRIFLLDASDPAMRRQYEGVFARKVAQGCANNESVSALSYLSDCDERIFFAANGMSAVSAFCAAKCCRGPDPPPECPLSCSASVGNATR